MSDLKLLQMPDLDGYLKELAIYRVVRFPTIGVLEDSPGVIIVSLNQKFYFGVSFIDFSIKNISKTRK